jgi:A/G-specific adenine glycosylase
MKADMTTHRRGRLRAAEAAPQYRGAAPEKPSPVRATRVRQAMIRWFDRQHRDLPWRRTRDAYAIWVSEIMLQQTRVETVIPYFERWMARFPTVQTLAAAPLDDVLRLWAGLGYYSRARNLHRAAGEIVANHAGRIPTELPALLALPGVGRYTAGAVASIAFHQRAALVDGNVERVFARLFLTETRDQAWAIAEQLVPAGAAAASFNQALMELGATVCVPRQPMCLVCPVRPDCQASALGLATVLPPPRAQKQRPVIEAVVVAVHRAGKWLLVRRPPHGLWGGLWEFPTVELMAGESHARGARRALHDRTGLRGDIGEELAVLEHTLTHRHMRFHIRRAQVTKMEVTLSGYDGAQWLTPADASRAAISSATRRALALVSR